MPAIVKTQEQIEPEEREKKRRGIAGRWLGRAPRGRPMSGGCRAVTLLAVVAGGSGRAVRSGGAVCTAAGMCALGRYDQMRRGRRISVSR